VSFRLSGWRTVTEKGRVGDRPGVGRPVFLTLFGAPGSGKGTQAAYLVEQLKIPQISTGELLRAEAASGTKLGHLAKEYMDRGDLVPDDLTVEVFRRRLASPDVDQGVLLDGFPRTVPQAVELDSVLLGMGRSMDKVIFIRVAPEELVSRLSGRLTCPVCGRTYHPVLAPPRVDALCDRDGAPLIERDDDKPETARRRIAVYLQRTVPVLEYYRRRGLVDEVSGEGDIAEVRRRIMDSIAAPHGGGE
jgi:adenylate kinase